MKDFQKNAMREAMKRVYSWKQGHPEEYSRFSLDMMKVERNDFCCFERIFKMAVGCADVCTYRVPKTACAIFGRRSLCR